MYGYFVTRHKYLPSPRQDPHTKLIICPILVGEIGFDGNVGDNKLQAKKTIYKAVYRKEANKQS